MRNAASIPAFAALLLLGGCDVTSPAGTHERQAQNPAPWGFLHHRPSEVSELGSTASQADIARLAITVFPDGRGLPPGSGSVAQGRRIYMERCSACHGENGEGSDDYPRLVGGHGTLASAAPVQTIGSYWPNATTVFDYIRRAMPYQAPASLTPDETYAVTAYLLNRNGIVEERQVLDRHSLPSIRMPNRNGFVGDPRPDTPGARDEHRTGSTGPTSPGAADRSQ